MSDHKLEELHVQSQYRLLEKLRESEQRYRSLYLHAPIGLWELNWSAVKPILHELNRKAQTSLHDFLLAHQQEVVRIADAIQVIDVNQRVLEQLGAQSISELSFLRQFLTPENVGEFAACLVDLCNGKTYFQTEISVARIDGAIRQHQLNLIVVPGHEADLDSVVVTTHDITESKQARDALNSSRQFLHMSQQAGGIGTWEVDLISGRQIWSDTVFSQLGFPQTDEPSWDHFLAAIHPEDREPVMSAVQAHLQQNEKYEVEYRILDQYQRIRWMCSIGNAERDASGRPTVFRGIVQDISERKQADEKLRLGQRIFQATQEGIMVTDAHGLLVDVNPAFCKITGYSRTEVLGKTPRVLKSGRHDDEFYKEMWQGIRDNGHWSGEIWNRRKNGEIFAELITISALHDDSGVLTHYVGSISDITLLKQHEKQLELIAHYDALTGIPNRVLLIDRMLQAQAQTRRDKTWLAICYLDLDGFKPINDKLGHAAGDQVLIEIAGRIEHALRGGDTVARLGGDEFVILLLDVSDLEQCRLSVERLLAVIAEPILIEQHQFFVTASIGITLYPNDHEDPDTLLRHADQAMYVAKQSGKNRFHLFDPDQELQIRLQNHRLSNIEAAIRNSEFELFYQPKVDLNTGELVGVEALVRWRHPDLGLLLPSHFLPVIENSYLEIVFGNWVLCEAFNQLNLWHHEGFNVQMSVNIAVNHLQAPNFVESLQQKLMAYPALGQCLQIEILETAALMDIPRVVDIINQCQQLGISCALDDFGTGYSSLAYLRRLPADTLKIDVSFVRDMLIDKDDREIVKGVIALANTFNRITVAEGVESVAHFQLLRTMGCNIGQGYSIAEPMSASQLKRWYTEFSANTESMAVDDH